MTKERTFFKITQASLLLIVLPNIMVLEACRHHAPKKPCHCHEHKPPTPCPVPDPVISVVASDNGKDGGDTGIITPTASETEDADFTSRFAYRFASTSAFKKTTYKNLILTKMTYSAWFKR